MNTHFFSTTRSPLKVLLKTACAGLLMLGLFSPAHAAPATTWPFPASSTGVNQFENGTAIGLYNARVGFLIRKKDAAVLGIWSPRDVNLVDGQKTQPLWSLELMHKGAVKPDATDALKAAPVQYHFLKDKNTVTLQMVFTPVQVGADRCAVTANISLSTDDAAPRWRLNAKMLDDAASVWSVRYPQLQIQAADSDAGGNHLVIPYRRGRLDNYGKSMPSYMAVYPYPGSAVKFQFIAAYGEQSRHGFYLAAQDGQGYDKQIVWGNQPADDAVLLSIEHIPANRGVPGTSFEQPYDVVTQPFTGDWYDAARIYRAWWIHQIWASQGLLRDRTDVPDWLKRVQVMARPSTTKPGRTVALNTHAELALQKILNGRPLAGIWYGVYESLTGNLGLNQNGDGHLNNIRPDVEAAVRQLKNQDIHHLAYLQSMIYTPLDSDPQDNAAALKNVARQRDGQPYMYGDLGYSMDRSTTWWQDREIEESQKAMKAGFDGIYLDSFGKSSPECFAPDHGHPIGGGNTGIAGQRQMAQRILQAIRKINPDAVLSGEDPVEAFRDLVQVNLYSANVWPGYLPLYRVIWGDYSLGYGRVLGPSKEGPDNLFPEMANLFVNGEILGRVYTDGETIFGDPAYTGARASLQQMVGYGETEIEYLRFGEYLHPLEWNEPLPQVTFHESVQNSLVTLPAVAQSVTRSYVDGSVGIALVNISAGTLNLQVPVDPALRNGKSAAKPQATLWRMDATGKRTRLAQGKTPWRQALSLSPHEIAFLVLQ